LTGLLALVAAAFLMTGCSWIIRQVLGAPEPLPPAEREDPKIRGGMVLKISVLTSGKAEDYALTVSQAGEITLPLINVVKCEGCTLQELQEKLRTQYAQYFHEPQITAQFVYGEGLSPWGTVNVRGKVGREGPVNIPPTFDLTVTRALQLAGGITPLGNQNAVKITRTLKSGKKIEAEVDIEEIGKNGRVEFDYPLQNGDVIWVPEVRW
jgi:polysaccharide export outer membrane protein